MITDRDILNEIINEQFKTFEIYSKVCTIISVDETERTCEVSPIDDGANITKVRLQSILNGSLGLVLIPTVGSKVICTFINNEKAFVSASSQIDKMLIDTDLANINITDISITSDNISIVSDLTEINGGDNGGLININQIVNKLNSLITEINTLKTFINIHVHTSATPGSPTTPPVPLFTGTFSSFNANDFEDTKIKH